MNMNGKQSAQKWSSTRNADRDPIQYFQTIFNVESGFTPAHSLKR